MSHLFLRNALAVFALAFPITALAQVTGTPISLKFTTHTSSSSTPSNGPTITGITNNYSYIPAGFPNSGIAPGSIYAVWQQHVHCSTNRDASVQRQPGNTDDAGGCHPIGLGGWNNRNPRDVLRHSGPDRGGSPIQHAHRTRDDHGVLQWRDKQCFLISSGARCPGA